ncbi:epoxide hydrolase family protein [Chitinophaga japonensis]|uniref:Pimeloyl-ACP methyl ester carboxylesterase n=1 Tax=Chitinophaga japonensis TaxID=104662 RepID=A0A562T4Y7_CHIJA|nr:epoxide hydrolase family protein [Chitinophaga japonensis]TWI88572.1 pimeloyl-ACP methyl ester carboxylesterase [Chitinophaga japonensis]
MKQIILLLAIAVITETAHAQTQKTSHMFNVKPFRIDVQQTVLDDLQNRLRQTRWPDAPENAGWKYGTDPVFLQSLIAYWQDGYDWRRQEAALNEFPQFTAEIDGLTIHFLHIKSKNPNARPLLLLHGWPDCFYRYYKVIPLLTDDYDMVIPSIPGFGFSSRVAMTDDGSAKIFAMLMKEALGYPTFLVAGGDVGSGIAKSLANLHPENVAAIHLSDVGYPKGSEDWSTMTKAEQEFGQFIQQWWYTEGAYAMLHSTKPQTQAYGLNDSPVGLASWIIEKFNTWRTQDGTIEDHFTKDELITNIMIYWVSQTINSSMRTYAVNFYQQLASGQKVNTPTGVATFPGDAPTPKEWAERNVNLKRFTVMEKGGHFAALETPELWAREVDGFFKATR